MTEDFGDMKSLSSTQKKIVVNGRLTQMTEFNKERPKGLFTSTDFGSKGLYKDTTTLNGGTKSQSVFKEVANLRLAGNTFDANHMDKFLNTQFCQNVSPSRVLLTQTKNPFSSSLSQLRMSPQQVRQSNSFTSIDREHKGQQRIYIDQYDGPSSLIKRDNMKTIKEQIGGEKYIYDQEREKFATIEKDFSQLQRKLYEDDGLLKSSRQRFLETVQVKEDLAKVREYKEQQKFVGRRDRVLKNGWRHGILGVENVDDPGTDIYSEVQQNRNYGQEAKEHINGRRYKKIVKSGGVSSQIDFARAGVFNEVRKDEKTVVDMYPDWKRKQVSPARFQDTHKDIFVSLDVAYNPLRASKLKLEEKRDRPFNIITGEHSSII